MVYMDASTNTLSIVSLKASFRLPATVEDEPIDVAAAGVGRGVRRTGAYATFSRASMIFWTTTSTSASSTNGDRM